MTLTYTGEGRVLVGIPDTDLTDDDIAAIAASRNVTPAQLRKVLADSGLYAASKSTKKEPTEPEA